MDTPTTTDLAPLNTHVHDVECEFIAVIAALTDPLDAVLVEQRLADIATLFGHLRKLAEQRAVELIQEQGEVTIGGVRHYVGTPKTYKARDSKAVMDAMLDLTGGDSERVVSFLQSQPWKHGAIKSALEEAGKADAFADLFDVTEQTELKEGKPVKTKRLLEANPRFLK